jgi:hypothetical protein
MLHQQKTEGVSCCLNILVRCITFSMVTASFSGRSLELYACIRGRWLASHGTLILRGNSVQWGGVTDTSRT